MGGQGLIGRVGWVRVVPKWVGVWRKEEIVEREKKDRREEVDIIVPHHLEMRECMSPITPHHLVIVSRQH